MDRETLLLADSLAASLDTALARSREALSIGNTVKAEALATEAGELARQIADLLPEPGSPVVTVTLSERRTHWGPASRSAGMEKAA